MTTIWTKRSDMRLMGYFCHKCNLVVIQSDIMGSVHDPLCPNCIRSLFPLYDISQTAIHAITEGNNANGNG